MDYLILMLMLINANPLHYTVGIVYQLEVDFPQF